MRDIMWLLYLADVLGGLREYAITTGMLLVMGSLLIGLFVVLESLSSLSRERVDLSKLSRLVRQALILGFVLLLLGVFVPTRDTLYRLAALRAVNLMYQMEGVKDVVPKSVQVLELWLDQQLERLSK